MATRTTLKTKFAYGISGKIEDSVQSTLINEAAKELALDVNLASLKRRTAMSPALFDENYQYAFPASGKVDGIIDIVPQHDRTRFDDWRLTTFEEFDRLKEDQRMDQYGDPIRINRNVWTGENLIAVDQRDATTKLLVSKPVDDNVVTIDGMNVLGSWASVGDAENVVVDSANYIKGSASIRYDIGTGGTTTAGIYNASVTTFDVTDFKTQGSCFVWVYLSNATSITNFILRVGSSASAYYSMTATTANDGSTLVTGWNLLRFDFSGKSTAGTPDDDACDYVSLYMTKAAGKVSQTAFRFDNLIMALGVCYDILYYSKYPWILDSDDSWAEESAADADTINLDILEIKILEYKYRELAEGYLRNFNGVETNRQLYENQKRIYLSNAPDESLPIITTQYNIYKG